MIDGLCQRWHCLPSHLLAEPAHVIQRLLWYMNLEQAPDEAPKEPAAGGDMSAVPMETLG